MLVWEDISPRPEEIPLPQAGTLAPSVRYSVCTVNVPKVIDVVRPLIFSHELWREIKRNTSSLNRIELYILRMEH